MPYVYPERPFTTTTSMMTKSTLLGNSFCRWNDAGADDADDANDEEEEEEEYPVRIRGIEGWRRWRRVRVSQCQRQEKKPSSNRSVGQSPSPKLKLKTRSKAKAKAQVQSQSRRPSRNPSRRLFETCSEFVIHIQRSIHPA